MIIKMKIALKSETGPLGDSIWTGMIITVLERLILFAKEMVTYLK